MSRITRDIETMMGSRPAENPPWTEVRRVLSRRLQRHPIPVVAHFRHSLVLTYAFPKALLEPLLPPGLMLDTHGDFGFVAIAMVQTEDLRPALAPRCAGQDFFLSGYRIFARYRNRQGRLLRGLRILRSDTDRRLMAVFGNLLTHYNYHCAAVSVREEAGKLTIHVVSAAHEADLCVTADLENRSAPLPDGSPFANWRDARRFAGPLPFTFDYEAETHSLVLIEGVRRDWHPNPVAVTVERCTFFNSSHFQGVRPNLANAFYVANIDYRWNRGVVESLAAYPRQPRVVFA